jgi:hypothetical protein
MSISDAPLRVLRWPRLAIGMLLAGSAALSVHAVMLQALHVPFPDMSVVNGACKFVIRAIAMGGLIALAQYTRDGLRGSFPLRWGALFLIDATLTESLIRAPFMDAYCTTAWVFPFVSNIPKLLTIALGTALALLAAPRLALLWQKVAAAVVIMGITTYIANPLWGWSLQPIMHSIAALAPQGEWCELPYGADVLIPAYLSFIEPTLGCLGAVALTWDRLSPSRAIRFVQFLVLILAIKNQLITPFVYAAFAKLPLVTALFSEGQFALEAATLALLTGATWEWAHIHRAFEAGR